MTKRLSSSLDAPWMAVHVDDGSYYTERQSEQLARNIALARDLGAEVISINDPKIVNGIKRVAKQKGITQIIVGRATQNFFLQFIKGVSLVDQLTEECKDIDIHIVREEKKQPLRIREFFHFNWKGLPLILGLSALFALANWLLLPLIGYKMVGALFLSATLLFSLFFKKGPIFISSLFFFFAWIFFFIPPRNSFEIESEEDIALVTIYLIATLSISMLITREKEHKDILEKSEESTRALYEMVNQIATAPSTEAILKFIKERFDRILQGKVAFAIKNMEGEIDLEGIGLITNNKEQNAALWSFANGKEAGWSTNTLPLAENLYIPLKGYNQITGLLIYRPLKKQPLTTEEKNFVYTVCQQLSDYLVRSFVREKTFQHENLRQMQKIQKMILDRFSHAFQWPLDTIKAAIKNLKDSLSKDEKKVLFHEFYQLDTASEVLTKNLNNIATITELTEGMTPLKKTLQPVSELLQNVEEQPANHKVKVTIEENLPPLLCDPYLIQILLNNLMVNAMEYSPAGTLIEIDAKQDNGNLCISISDQGKGIPEEHINTIFDKFYRLPNEPLPESALALRLPKLSQSCMTGT